ncbi:MAG: hypothetical protein ACREX8_12145, partial [Gammaproteobacteria bacterium]
MISLLPANAPDSISFHPGYTRLPVIGTNVQVRDRGRITTTGGPQSRRVERRGALALHGDPLRLQRLHRRALDHLA